MSKKRTIDPGSEIDLTNVPTQIRAVLETSAEFGQRDRTVKSSEELEKLEEDGEGVADILVQALVGPALQQAVDSPEVQELAKKLVAATPNRMRLDGRTTVNVRTSRGTVVPITTAYYRQRSHEKRKAGRKRKPGLYPELEVLGIHDRCTPKLASKVSRCVAMLCSLSEAQANLEGDGIQLDVKTIRTISYRYAARARAAQQAGNLDLGESTAGRRVVISLDGGRVRVRRKKRGKKTPKGRSRFSTDWHEPKLLIIYVVDKDGRPCRSWAPIIDGTLKRGPGPVFDLLESYARQLDLVEADKVLFVADGAPWIWNRIASFVEALGLRPTQVLMLIDFYHATQHLADAVKLRRWNSKKRKQWLTRNRRLLLQGKLSRVIDALKELCRGRNAGKIRTHLGYFVKNEGRFAYDKLKRRRLPQGSGAIESAIRRVVNLRIKGASIYWLEENVEAILLLRSYYKSKRWRYLERMASDPHVVLP